MLDRSKTQNKQTPDDEYLKREIQPKKGNPEQIFVIGFIIFMKSTEKPQNPDAYTVNNTQNSQKKYINIKRNPKVTDPDGRSSRNRVYIQQETCYLCSK